MQHETQTNKRHHTDILVMAAFLLLIVSIGICVMLFRGDVPADAAGKAYGEPGFVKVSIGGDAKQRDQVTGVLPLMLWVSMLAFVAVTISIAIPTPKRTVKFALPLFVILLIQLGVVSAIFLSYQKFWQTSEITYFAGFPLPTAIVLYGVWPSLALYGFYYVWRFREIVWSDGDQAEFERILKDYKDSPMDQG